VFKDRLSDGAKIRVRKLLARAGLEIGAYKGSFAEHRLTLLRQLGVKTVWDVGAHVGQYASGLREHGFQGHLISVEPATAAHADLARRAAGDSTWTVVRAAAAGADGESTLNVSGNGQSSSLLPMLPVHQAAAPSSAYVATEVTPTVRLDTLLTQLEPPEPFALKLDVQGYESVALDGAGDVLNRSAITEVELSLVPLYDGGANWHDLVERMSKAGLRLCDIERVYHDPVSGDLLQINGLFRRDGEGAA
jgi:FkbM family methyltransferase